MNVQRRLAVAAAVTMAGLVFSSPAAGQVVIQNFPNRLAAGPDYATEVLGDPWDMSNAEDIGLSPYETGGWASFAVSGGLAGGTTALTPGGAADTSLSLLHRGYWGLINPGKNGRNFPIDSDKYRKLSFRMSSGLAGEVPHVYWFHSPLADPGDTGFGLRYLTPTVAGFQVYVADLTQGSQGTPWTAAVARSLRIDPNHANAGHEVFFDWVRLTAADNAPGAAMQVIQWTGGGGATIEVLEPSGSTVILTVATNASSGFNWNYGVLPPGNYWLRVRVDAAQDIRAFSINNPPTIRVTDPSRVTGEDYATSVLGNPWNMDGPEDVQLAASSGITNVSFDGEMHATNTNADPNVTVLYNTNNATPIDTSKFRYFTYRLRVDGPFDMALGSVARLFWTSGPWLDAFTATTTRDILVWAGTNSYTIDLATLSAAPDGGLEATGAAEIWTAAHKRILRLDPHEFSTARTFHIDDIKLTAKPVSLGTYTVRFTGSDADGDPTTVTLYWDTDLNPWNGRTAIASVAIGAGQYLWNTAGLSPGEYYIYAEANDGIQAAGSYSDAPIRVAGAAELSDPLMNIDAPGHGVMVPQPFALSGWAIDRGASSGTGVDTIHVYAYPGAGAPIFIGVAQYSGQRTDIGNAFGAQFTNSGYSITVAGLPPGTYTLVAHAHSTVTNTFNQSRSVIVTIPASSPAMNVDSPAYGATLGQPFVIGGWAIDRASGSGTGVDSIHVYAYPNPGSGTPPIFLGVASYGASRPDVGAFFGASFTNSGFNLSVSGLSPGRYLLVVFAHSTVAGTFNSSRSVDITISGPSSDPLMNVDTPQPGSHPGSSFVIAGWAIDRGAPNGTGVDTIHVWAYPVGGSPFFLGVGTYGSARPDVGGVFGARFTNSGYGLNVSGLGAGTYDLAVYGRSTVTGTFNQVRVVRVIVP
jgi:hypothetical protein